jgi:putative hydrolase of the HAD superfamily
MLDVSKIRAISLDLDDTLWPIGPTILRAEEVLAQWLTEHAPGTALLLADPQQRREIRGRLELARPDLSHDLSALRRESLRMALLHCGEDPALAEPAFEVFFAQRMRVQLYPEVLAALQDLSARFPLVALSNGNADVQRVGLGGYFCAAVSAREFGVAKPDARIFHAAAQAAGVAAAEVLHVGDDPLLDVLAGLDAGMQVVWVNRQGQDWGHPRRPHGTVAELTALSRMLAG